MERYTHKEKWMNSNGNINIQADIDKADIPKIIAEENIHSLQLYTFENPSKQTWETLNEFYKQYPNIGLRIVWRNTLDLAFYKEIPNVRRFTISSYETKDYSPLLSNLNIKHLGIQETKSKAVDLSFIKEFKDLESLYIDGMKKGLENITYLNKLKSLSLRGVKMDNFEFITQTNTLEQLFLSYGSYKNVDAITRLKQLKQIGFSRVGQIPEFNFLNTLKNLEFIEFEGMSTLEEIPELSNLSKLKKIVVGNNLRLKSIEEIGQIPNLKVLQLSFGENSKKAERQNLIDQAVAILMKSKSIQYTSILNWTDEVTKKKLTDKGIKAWRWDIEI